jgi:hypothetical protein
MPDPSAQAPQAIAPAETAPQATAQATAEDPHRTSTTAVGIKPFRIGSEPFNLVQWEANTHEIAEKMMGGQH